VQRRAFRDAVLCESLLVFELLACEDQSLSFWLEVLRMLDLQLDVFDLVLFVDSHLKGLPSDQLDGDRDRLQHARDHEEHWVINRDIGNQCCIVQMLALGDQPLLLRQLPRPLLELPLHVQDGGAGWHEEGHRLAPERLHRELTIARLRLPLFWLLAQSEDQVQRGLVLDLVLGERPAAILQLLLLVDKRLVLLRRALGRLDPRL